MKRILISQSENLDGSDFLVLNGQLISDKGKSLEYAREVITTDDFTELYKDEFITVKKNGKQIYLTSHYINTDSAGRQIHYMYLVKDNDNLDTILNHLENDSKILGRKIDDEETKKIIEYIKKNDSINSKLDKIILGIVVAVGLATILYFISK